MSDILGLILNNKLLTILITMFGIFYGVIIRMRSELNEKKKEFMENILISKSSVNSFQNEIKEQLNHTPNLYKEELQRVLGFLDKHLEKLTLFSTKAFDKYLTFSLIYSFLFFYLVWLFGGSSQIGTHLLIPNENRLITTCFLIFEIILIRNYFPMNKANNFLIMNSSYFSHLSHGLQVFLILLEGMMALLVSGIFSFSILAIVTHDNTTLIVSMLGIVGTITIGIKIIKIIMIVIIISVLLNGFNSLSILYLLFFLILPFANAIFDYLSMLTSRYFAQKILYKHTKKLDIFLDIFWDLLVATILFVTLAFSLYYIIDFSNIYLIKDEALFIPIEYYKDLLLSGNLLHPDVLWITLMFVSTLIPTFIHLYLFVYSLMAFVIVKPHLHQIVEELEELDLENHHKKELVAYKLADYRLTGWLRVHNFFLSALAIGFFVILGVLLSKLGFLN